MPIVNGRYVQRTADDIIVELENELREQFGADIDLTESSVFSTLAESYANVNAEEFEPALQEVYDSAFLDTAEGQSLDRLVELIGIQRQSAVNATGVVEFRHGGKVDQTYTITNGTVVSTGGTDPIDFETSEIVRLLRYEDWESGTLGNAYDGDLSDFTVQQTNVNEGTYSLECGATQSLIYSTDKQTYTGHTIEFDTYLTSNTIAGNVVGIEDTSKYYETVIDSNNSRHKIVSVEGGTETDLESESTSVPTDTYLTNEVVLYGDDNGTIISRVYDGNTLVSEIEATDIGEEIRGGYGYHSKDTNGNIYWDVTACTSVEANIRATEGGGEYNVGVNTLTTMPAVPAGVSDLTNRKGVGDIANYDTALNNFNQGQDREDDDELKERVRESVGRGGNATVNAIIAELRSIADVESVRVYENKTDSTDAAGQTETSFEAVVYGGANDDIAEALHESKGLTAQDVGGVRGTEVSAEVTAINGQTFTYNWSEPTNVDVDMTLDIVVNDNYVGDDQLRDRIADYIGGTFSDGSTESGTGVGEDIYVDQIEDVVTGPNDTGVIGISSYDFTPSVSTDVNGLEVVAIGETEVGRTNGADSSIVLNVTEM